MPTSSTVMPVMKQMMKKIYNAFTAVLCCKDDQEKHQQQVDETGADEKVAVQE